MNYEQLYALGFHNAIAIIYYDCWEDAYIDGYMAGLKEAIARI